MQSCTEDQKDQKEKEDEKDDEVYSAVFVGMYCFTDTVSNRENTICINQRLQEYVWIIAVITNYFR